MSTQAHIPEDRKWCFDIILADGFVLTEFAAIADALRVANRVSAQPCFRWTCRSAKGGVVTSPSSAFVETDPIPEKPD
ncbi:MAG: AraC family transcriptional regulator, partial [Pseudomonadota bacterium]